MNLILILQMTVSILLLLSILIQAKGSSLGRAFGGMTSYHTKRGAERALFVTTIALSITFVLLSLLNLTVNR
ncbi:preprotein translocase subunit SecG [Candidatus Collierbacteria bacterium RIFCSPLOWO2_01_FULL_50_23]|uniref:Protein-export membrane protein SecG n=2 Tax=Candidatus Collieribacteriota TaxID=1752725 RepID=A0A1F5ESE6_9BACT|nr:MAG: preprotein translocase subunit SecG [Candidatus Collierbacteria bacterium RIFCSPHIGHO2_02_FULL_49_10]OGD72459.1 MAG: preprotein translocase subunit SecG [Candidatus Collierbacteria bacterium RIFCSPHIGHO2_01_FULL_50_25]OGD75053.1 MAG: preprotein translocase subunit SecG [Candidatus Collierbacteria bacterium RIFCSPLOWO2_01_FULL_50_23]